MSSDDGFTLIAPACYLWSDFERFVSGCDVKRPANLSPFARILFTLFAILWINPGHVQAGLSEEVDLATAGRLGGTLQSFVVRFGDPVEINESAGPIFVTDTFGYLSVQVDRIQGTHGLEGRARVITARSQRSEETPADVADDGDWTIDEATEHIGSLLPVDAELGELVTDETGQTSAECQSDALKELFGAVSLGQCRISLITPTPDSVSFVTIALTGGAADQATAESGTNCENALVWVQAAGKTLSEIELLLQSVIGIDEEAEDSAEAVSEIAGEFHRLAVVQRDSDPPEELSEANFYLVSGLNSYAAAFEVASQAILADDPTLADDAVETLGSAQGSVNNAIKAIRLGSEHCNLQLATPESA